MSRRGAYYTGGIDWLGYLAHPTKVATPPPVPYGFILKTGPAVMEIDDGKLNRFQFCESDFLSHN